MPLRIAALLLTVLTGFSGLVYEVAWEKYLATLLGAHSEATAAVLGLFLGGLSLGYSLFGAVTRRLVELFDARFNPALKQDGTKGAEAAAKRLLGEIEAHLEQVSNLDEDRIIRRFLNVIQSTLRTNFRRH